MLYRNWRRRAENQVQEELVRLHPPHSGDPAQPAQRSHHQAGHVQPGLEQGAGGRRVQGTGETPLFILALQ
jgi:hypothetical protein